MKEYQTFLKTILTKDDVVTSIRENLKKILFIIPELKKTIGFDQMHPHHHLDVFEHTLLALSLSENNFDVRLILLLHDIGKPNVATMDEKGIRHFRGHGLASQEISKNILTRLGFNKDYVEKICKIIKEHDDKLSEEDIKNNITEAKLKLKVQTCDGLAHNPTTHKYRYAYFNFVKKTIEKFENAKEY